MLYFQCPIACGICPMLRKIEDHKAGRIEEWKSRRVNRTRNEKWRDDESEMELIGNGAICLLAYFLHILRMIEDFKSRRLQE